MVAHPELVALATMSRAVESQRMWRRGLTLLAADGRAMAGAHCVRGLLVRPQQKLDGR